MAALYQRSAGGRLVEISPNKSGESRIPQPGVRYINDDMLKKVGRQDQIEQITTLNLTLTKDTAGKKIKYLENLERLKKLQVLNLSCNIIEKMEKLDKLTKLRELNLSYNKLTKIEGIETLTCIQVLNFTGNEIEHIPVWLPKKLKAMRIFKIAKNQIETLSELTKLRPLKDLTQLSSSENPVSQLGHYRGFLLFHLRTVDNLDGEHVTLQERHTATVRFKQDAVESLESELQKENQEKETLKEEHEKSLHELEEREKRTKQQQERLKESHVKITELSQELETKNDLLKRKTAELNKACEKHYELEQELAFYKIDHKFDTLAKPQAPTSDSEMSVDENGLMGESPYIGKGRFQKNQQARRAREHAAVNYEEREREIEQLDRELEEKHNGIDEAQERLRTLQEELINTEEQLTKAAMELEHLAISRQKANQGNRLTEDDKQHMRSKLSNKMDKVNELRQNSQKIEHEMAATNVEIGREEQYIGQIRGRLQRMGSRDSLYTAMQQEVEKHEERLAISRDQYTALQQQLEDMLHTIAQEAGTIQTLETHLREGQAAHNDNMKSELNSIISGLQQYLSEVQGKADRQRDEYDALLRERGQLSQQLHDLEHEKSMAEEDAAQVTALKQKLEEAENEISEANVANKTLHFQLNESRIRTLDDADLSVKVQEADEEVARLRAAIEETDRRAQAEKASLEKRVAEEKRKFGLLKHKVRNIDEKDDELSVLQKQLAELQQSNARLQDKLYAQGQKLLEEKRKNVDPSQLRKRLDDVVKAIRGGRSVEALDSEDEVGQALEQLQDKMHRELNKSNREADQERNAKEKAQQEASSMRDAIVQAQEEERSRAEQAIQAILDDHEKEKDQLRQQLDRLLEELEKERESANHPPPELPIPDHLLQPSAEHPTGSSGSSTTSATVSTEDTVPSSQWSKKKQELYDTMTQEEQDLFDELQQEIDELKRLLGMGGSKEFEVAKVASSIDKKAQKLRDMIESRKSGSETSRSSKKSVRSSGYSSRTKESMENPVLKLAARDLARAHEEIEELNAKLKQRTKQLKHAPSNDRSDQTIAHQQEEIDELHDLLEEQKNEIQHLNDALEQLSDTERNGAQEERLDELLRGAETVASRLGEHRNRFHSSRHRDAQGRQRHAREPAEDGRYAADNRREPAGNRREPAEDRRYAEEIRRNPAENRIRPGEKRREPAEDRRELAENRREPADKRRHLSGDERYPAEDGRYPADNRRYPAEKGMFPEEDGRYPAEDGRYPDDRRYPAGDGRYPAEEGRYLTEDGRYPAEDGRYPDGQRYPAEVGRYPADDPRYQSGNEKYPIEDQRYPPNDHRQPGQHDRYGPHDQQQQRQQQQYRSENPAAYDGHYPADGLHHPYAPPQPQQGRPVPVFYDGQQPIQQPGPHNMGQDPHIVAAPPGHASGAPAGYGMPPGATHPMTQHSSHPNAGVLPSNSHPSAGVPPAMSHPSAGVLPTTSHPSAGVLPTTSHPSAGVPQPISHPSAGVLPTTSHPSAGVLPPNAGGIPGSPYHAVGADGAYAGMPQGVPSAVSPGVMFLPSSSPGGGRLHSSTGLAFSAPTTPIAGSVSGGGTVLPTTPTGQQPVMMSTPVLMSDQRLKGILKNGTAVEDEESDEEGLMCTVPEHHDLEDYVDKLQNKLKSLKQKMRQNGESSSMFHSTRDENNDSSKRVLFEDDVDKKTIKRLQSELQNRRAELEGLDLAVERQKKQLTDMEKQEAELLSQRQTIGEELDMLRGGQYNRRAFLDGRGDYHTHDDDYDYEYHPRVHGSRKDFLVEEIHCIEATLGKRRAELREADRLLQHCELDLKDVQAQSNAARSSLAKSGYGATVEDLQEIEDRTRQAAVLLLKTEEEAARAKIQMEDIQAESVQHQALLQEVKQLMSSKDEEFRSLDQQIKEASANLQNLRAETIVTEAKQEEKMQLMRESEKLVADQRREVETMRQQLTLDKTSMASVQSDLSEGRSELDTILALIQKRGAQLDNLDDQVDREITSKRTDMQCVEDSVQKVKSQLGQMEQQLLGKEELLSQVSKEIEREEEVLQNLATTTNCQKEILHDLEENIQQCRSELDVLNRCLRDRENEVTKLSEESEQEKQHLKQLQSEAEKYSSEIDRRRQKVEEAKDELEALSNQRQDLESSLSTLQYEKDAAQDGYNQRTIQMKKSESQLQERIKASTRMLSRMDKQLHNMEHALQITHSDGQSGLNGITDTNEQKNGAENQFMTEDRFSNMEGRIREIAHEFSQRDVEKRELAHALERSYTEVQNLRKHLNRERQEAQTKLKQMNTDFFGLREQLEDRSKELIQQREKARSEIADLESIAQAHYSRANRVSDELAYIRAEYLDAKRKLENQSDLADKEKKLEAALKEFKEDIKTIGGDSPALSKSRSTSSSSNRLAGQCELGQQTSSSFGEQQDMLKQQLKQKMMRHSESMQAQKQISNQSITELQRKLNNLEQVLSQDSIIPTLDQMSAAKPVRDNRLDSGICLGNTSSQESSTTDQSSTSNKPKRAYSPHRHSNNRSRPTSGDRKRTNSPQIE